MPGLNIQPQQLEAALAIINAMLGQQATKAVGSPDFQPGHGPTGTFSLPQLDPTIYSAMQLPITGLQAQLPTLMTNYMTPLYGIVTGETASIGSEPTGPCGDYPEAGLTKLCTSFAPLSKQGRSSRVIDISRVGQYNDRSDFRQYTLVGDPFKNTDNQSNVPRALQSLAGGSTGNFLNDELYKQMRELRVAMLRDFAGDVFTGNPTNNTGTGGREYYRGLDLLINTGYRDVITGTVCPASDSMVDSFNNVNISAVTPSASIVITMDNQYFRLKAIAQETGTAPVKWALVMRRGLFYELTHVWPCAYYSTRCTVSGGPTEFIDAEAAIALRDEMRSGMYLKIQGENIPVIVDDSVPQVEVTPGVFRSKLYWVPFTVLGGIPVSYMEYFDFNGPGAAAEFVKNTNLFGVEVLDNGKYLMTLDKNNTCIKIQLISRQRILLRTPYLAGQLQNIVYQPIKPERSPFPSDPYFGDGGNTSYSAPSYYLPTTNG